MEQRENTFDFPPMGSPSVDAPMGQHRSEGGPAGGPPGGLSGGPPAGFGSQPIGIDPVTGVLNLAAFGQAFAELSGKAPARAALWYIDIRSFRSINPRYGYLIGNQVLTTVAEGIQCRLARELPITRLGGDRFVFVSVGIEFPEAHETFYALVEEVNDKISQLGVTNRITLVGGVYYLRDFDYERRDFKRALDYASIAHRNAQNNPHSTLVLFTDEDLKRDMRRIVIEQTIDQALEEGRIEVWYQPQVDYTYGEIVGAEALARWKHPDLGWITPDEFVPVLEACGKIHELDLFVWEEACRSAGKWRNVADGNPVPISVNVSRTEMFRPGLTEYFKDLQHRYALPDGSLHLEVTESAFVEEADRLYGIIRDLRANSIVVEMDDFGSGLSSLNMLKDVPVDVVKLDMGFIQSASRDQRGGVVLSSIIRMLQGLDTPIIAEGVETLEQAEMLKNMGCRFMQGFHFSPPMPLAEFESFIRTNTTIETFASLKRARSHLEDLMAFDGHTTYLFNEAIGGTMFFIIQGDQVESILVNDKFYEECGLERTAFGDRKINPLEEIDEESRSTLWRASAEAREFGSAMCIAKVRLTGRWFEACMRYIGDSTRGIIFSLTICRSGDVVRSNQSIVQAEQDLGWTFGVLRKIVPTGVVKCRLDENLTMDYASPDLVSQLGFSLEEFYRRFHQSFVEMVAVRDRSKVFELMRGLTRPDDTVDCEVNIYQGYGNQMRASIIGRLTTDVTNAKLLYLLVMLKGEAEEEAADSEDVMFERVIPFDYLMKEDRLVIHAKLPDGSVRDITFENWCAVLDKLPDNIDQASAAKVLATLRDLRHHPLAGFTDIKCNLRGGDALRWYHINYTCESDENGDTTVVHGFAQDANDEMGSARWWRRQAEICQLTGLLNRNAVEQKINLLLRRHGGGMMLMIDLDDFKRVNDEFGHLVGDDLLREVGSVLSEHFRESDALGRYGGDEFVAFMPTPPAGDQMDLARRRGQQVIDAISNIQLPDGSHAACSVGAAVVSTREASFYDLLEIADQALYDSKAAGKSTITIREMRQASRGQNE